MPHYERFTLAVPRSRHLCRRRPGRGGAPLVGPGLQPASPEPPTQCRRPGRGAWRCPAGRRGRPPCAAGDRSLHGAGRAQLRLRRGRGGGRHERGAGAGPLCGGTRPERPRGHAPGRPAGAARPVLGVQPIDVRPGRHRLHGAASLRPVPVAAPVCLAAPGLRCARSVARQPGVASAERRSPGRTARGGDACSTRCAVVPCAG